VITKIRLPLLIAMLSAACVLSGCQSPKAKSPSGSSAAQSTRNNCYSLLYQLLSDQKDVKSLVKKIAGNSATGAKLLEEFAKHDPSINLDDIQLPPGEAATREAIASTKKKELLGQTGDEFELTLLLTQTEALSYAWHLAKVAGENESQPDRASALAGVSKDMENLYHEVFAMLLSRLK
jgi:outer membrane murein-binding lipoprotein Lpp